jgi:hypothetical protein
VQAYDTFVPIGQENPGSVPLLGTLRAAPNTYNQRRKTSRYENQRHIISKKRSAAVSVTGQSNDLEFLPEPRTKTKACSICKCPGHQRGSCPKIHRYNKPPLDMNKDMLSRHELSSALSKVGSYKTDYLPIKDKRPMSSSTPVGLLGVVIHRRFFRNQNPNKMCLECTILDQVGDPHPTFKNYLFTCGCMLVYVSRSKTNIVVCELENVCSEGFESFGFSMSQPPPTVQYLLSQSDQMGYGLLSQSEQMGYEFSSSGMSWPL